MIGLKDSISAVCNAEKPLGSMPNEDFQLWEFAKWWRYHYAQFLIEREET